MMMIVLVIYRVVTRSQRPHGIMLPPMCPTPLRVSRTPLLQLQLPSPQSSKQNSGAKPCRWLKVGRLQKNTHAFWALLHGSKCFSRPLCAMRHTVPPTL